MKKLLLPILLAVATVATVAPAATAQTTCPAAPAPVVATNITSDTRWTKDNIYLLQGYVYVRSGATLTIEPGTIIKGDKAVAPGGTLVVEQGAKLIADGTATQPIVFTSNQPAGSRNRGDWGGIVICGRAPINQTGNPSVEGVPGANFGGNQPDDNSGILRYVRIEYPGIALATNNEINGLTLAGVGSGTTIDYVQVYASGDDSFEWFGGTVNAKHLVAVSATDDDFDTDYGYTGKVQYAVTVRTPNAADVSGSTAFESDNDSQGSSLTPITAPVFSNVSAFLLNPSATANFTRAIHLRRNTQLSLFNSVLTGWPVGLTLEGSGAQGNATAGSLVLKNNVMAGMTTNFQAAGTGTTSYDVAGFWNTAGNSNTTYAAISALNLYADNFNATNSNGTASGTPSFELPAASPLVSGAAYTDAKLADSFFDKTPTFRGAFGATNWAAGWTNFNPLNTCYNRAGLTLANKAASEQLQGLSVAPNPTAGASTLSFELKSAAVTSVRVVDALGRNVATIEAGRLGAGLQQLALPASLNSGLYVATVTTNEASQTVRFVVTK